MRNHSDHIYHMALCALFAAFLCVVSPIAIPLGPIPMTMGLLGVLLAGAVLGPIRGSTSVLLYLLLGLCGLPIFGGWQGGIGVITGPTGGFLWGYLPTVLLVGSLFSRRRKNNKSSPFSGALFCFFGVLLSYTCGVFQYMGVANAPFSAALGICVLPFLLVDLVKCLLVGFLAPRLAKIAKDRRK